MKTSLENLFLIGQKWPIKIDFGYIIYNCKGYAIIIKNTDFIKTLKEEF
jgi:hypothetical protein